MAEAPLAVAALAVVLVGMLLDGERLRTARASLHAPLPTAPVDDVTVLVAVRSGDPLLPSTLAASVRTLAPARVLLLVDDDDPAGSDAALAAASAGEHVEVVVCPPPAPGINPKVHKQLLVQSRLGPVVALLDDDTVLPPGGLGRLVGALAAEEGRPGAPHAPGSDDASDGRNTPDASGSAPRARGDLVTGVPLYREQGGPWSRLTAAFVNGSALVTYLPMAHHGPPVSVNGMVVATRRESLEAIGGFAAIADATCDDYALARAYRARGLRIVQTAQPASLATTVPGPGAWARLMRRWMLFATRVVRLDPSPRLLALVVLPSVLPLAALGLAVASGRPTVAGVVVAWLLATALGTRALRAEVGRGRETGAGRTAEAGDAQDRGAGTHREATGLVGVLLEPVAALASPVFALAAALGPKTVRWRGRTVRVGVGTGAGACRAPGAPGVPGPEAVVPEAGAEGPPSRGAGTP